MAKIQRVAPCLWFDNQAEEAARFYVGIFKRSKINAISRYSKAGFEIHGRPEGSVMWVEFVLDGQLFSALNGGPMFKFTEAVSMMINCETQAEIDYYWERLGKGGKPQQCGWVKDKYGLSWQVTPTGMHEMYEDHKSEKARRVMAAMMGMKKLDIAALKRAYEG